MAERALSGIRVLDLTQFARTTCTSERKACWASKSA